MASTYTSNIGLEKPDGNDDINVIAINGNMDKLDAAIRTMMLLVGDFTSVSPGGIGSIVSFPNSAGRYIAFFWYNGYTFTNSMSMYFFQRDANGNVYGVQQITKGSETRTVTMGSDGTVTKGDNNSYNVRCAVLRLTV